MLNKRIKVIIAGSGALYPIYLGSLCCLKEMGYEITAIAGTSGGAIATATWSLSDIQQDFDSLSQFVQDSLPINNKGVIAYSFWNFIKRWGFIDGLHLQGLFETFMFDAFGKAKIPTYIYASDVSRQSLTCFSSDNHAEHKTSEIIRASCSIPFIFTPTKIEDKLYVDGGWTYHFPVDCFSDTENVLGLRIVSSKEKNLSRNFIDYMQGLLFGKIIDDLKQQQVPDTFKTIDFESNFSRQNLGKTTSEEAQQIFLEGYEQTKRKIAEWQT